MQLQLSPDDFRPLLRELVAEAVQQIQAAQQQLPADKLTYSEPEAAALLGVKPHVLRDERRRGKIQASSIVGRRVRYLRSDLIGYVLGRREPIEGAD